MIQMLILDCFGFPKPRNDEGRGTRNMGMLRAGSFPKPRNDDRGEGRETWACSAPGAFPSLAMTIKGRGEGACRKQARRQPHPFAMTGTGREGICLKLSGYSAFPSLAMTIKVIITSSLLSCSDFPFYCLAQIFLCCPFFVHVMPKPD